MQVGDLYVYKNHRNEDGLAILISEFDSSNEARALIASEKSNIDAPSQMVEANHLLGATITSNLYIYPSKQTLIHKDQLGALKGRLPSKELAHVLKATIQEHTSNYYKVQHQPSSFSKGESVVPYAGRVYDDKEISAGVSSTLDFWLTLGKEGDAFEKELANYLKVRSSILVNSGSSANLVATMALTSHELEDRRLKPGDEVITVASGFPTTITPIIQAGAIPVLCDVNPLTGNICVEQLEDAYSKDKTKAVILAHALGNPFDLYEVQKFCKDHNLWLIEDNCDALGSAYDQQLTGSFGDLSTQSFYPPHHLTMGEGGAVNISKQARLKKIAESFRDWGRDCWCPSGKDNTCKQRFSQSLGELPHGYDHKYIYSHLGYNLKPIDIQAAIGLEQLKKLPSFVEARQNNWTTLRQQLTGLEDALDFMQPTHSTTWNGAGFNFESGKAKVNPSWFAFMMLVKQNSTVNRVGLAKHCDEAKIGNRMFFGGNMTKQPVMVTLKQQAQNEGRPAPFRVIGNLEGSDRIMNDGIFIGVYPGLSEEMLAYMSETVRNYCENA